MASTYSDLKFELIGTGEQAGSWGSTTNDNIGTAIEQALVGLGNPVFTSDTNLTISLSNTVALQTARALVLNATSTGSLTVTRELVVPTIEKQYIVQNNTSGGQSITVKTSGGTGITVPNGRKAHLYVDGTNVIQMFDFVDINGGAIDGTVIGGATTAAGSFTTLNATVLTATADSAFTSTGAVQISKGTTAERPTGVTGKLRFNTTTGEFEGYTGAGWASVGGSAIVNDTSTASNIFPLMASATSGTALTVNTSNAKLLYKPSTGEFQSTVLVASNGIVVNSQTVAENYTIAATNNAMSSGPITINSGITVTVSSGSRWAVV
jgi:hypothetical protein